MVPPIDTRSDLGRMLSRYPAPPLPMQPQPPTRRFVCSYRKTGATCASAIARPRVLVRERALHAKGGQGSSSGGSAFFSAKAKSRSTGARPSSSATATPRMVRPHPRPTCAFCNTCQLCRADSQATCDLCRQCVLCTPGCLTLHSVVCDQQC